VDRALYSLPLFGDEHRSFASSILSWASQMPVHHGDVDLACRAYVKALGEAGWLRHTIENIDVRTLCIARETLGYHSGVAEFAFAMQGLGAGPISLFGSPALRERYLPRVARGELIPAFAISEANAGSDVAAMSTVARRDGDSYVIDGAKTWISNAGIADLYVVFARLDDGYVALAVEASDEGFEVSERFDMIAPHAIGSLRFDGCRVPADRVVGEPGRGLRVAFGTLDVFRTTVGAAALGFARRALDEALAYVSGREMFGGRLSDLQMTQSAIADMATDIDASALLVYRSAWKRDNGAERVTREAAMAKMYATEAAQRVIDRAVQLIGARGVVAGNVVERLYREIRSLRIYEGATEVQKLIIAGQVLKNG
jgi:acyl-CoA dehydrogenase